MNYINDGDGRRVEKSGGTIYWYGMNDAALDETDLHGNLTNEYVFFGGKRIARRDASGNVFYYVANHLGTSREIVQAGQTSLCYDGDFYPFGGERVVTNTCSQNYKFEGKERDTESGNDDFGARYYSSRIGRWLSADWSSVPVPVPYANLTNPQTLNLYAMVSDNPETFADLDGHCGPNLISITGTVPCPNRPQQFMGGIDEFYSNSGIGAVSCSMYSCTSAAEVSAQASQIAAQQAAAQAARKGERRSCGFWCRLFHRDKVPAREVIVGSKDMGSFTIYYYQLENAEGQKLKGNGYAVEEHISPSEGIHTSEGTFVPADHGVSEDVVGYADWSSGQAHAVTLPSNYTRADVLEQTFTVSYRGKPYNLTTRFEHLSFVLHGDAWNLVIDRSP